MKRKNKEHPEAQKALQKIETKNYEPWEIQRMMNFICATGEFSLIRRAILFLESDGHNPLNR